MRETLERLGPGLGRVFTGALLALAGAGAGAAPAEAGDAAPGALTGSWPVAEATSLHFEFPVGELTLVATDGKEVKAFAEVDCWSDDSDCLEVAEDYRFTSRRAGKRLIVKLEGPRFNFGNGREIEARVEVPRSLLLDVDMGIGELTLTGFEHGADIALGIGEVEIHSPRGSVRDVRLRVGLGEASFDDGRRSIERVSVFGNGLHWKAGTGNSTVAVKLGIGEASVVLN
ncbi:MAG: hypothetical protein ACREOU_08160 [Candidatus Eiseniibacteriota bacterium]